MKIPNKDGKTRFVNSDHVKIISLDGISVLLGLSDRLQTKITIEFESDAEAVDFIDKNFILFNK